MPVSRTRQRSTSGPVGSFAYGSVYATSEPTGWFGVCQDILPAPDKNLTIRQGYYQGAGLTFSSAAGHVLANYTPGLYRSPTNDIAGAYASSAGRPTDSVLAVQCLKQTNPSNAYLDVPVSVVDTLIDGLPNLLKSLGDSALRRLIKKYPEFGPLPNYERPSRRRNPLKQDAHADLFVEFGLAPLISDARKVLDFERKVQNRIALLRKLSTRSILRKTQLWSGSDVVPVGTFETGNSSPVQCYIRYKLVQRTTTRKVWGYVRYSPTITLKTMTNEQIRRLAIDAVAGLHIDFVTAWELLPWSWLVDWFSNIGDYLQAHRNVVPCTASTPIICETVRVEELRVSDTNNIGMPLGYHSHTGVFTRKLRKSVSASLPSANLPLLTERQVGILTSLAMLRHG